MIHERCEDKLRKLVIPSKDEAEYGVGGEARCYQKRQEVLTVVAICAILAVAVASSRYFLHENGAYLDGATATEPASGCML